MEMQGTKLGSLSSVTVFKPNQFSTLYSATVTAQTKQFSTLHSATVKPHSASHCSNQTSSPPYILPVVAQTKQVIHATFCHSHCSNQTVLHTTFCHSQTTFCQSLLKPNKFSTLHSASCCSNQTSYPCYILPQSLLKPNKLYVLHSASHYSNQTSSPHYIQPHSLLKQVLHTTFCQSLLKPNKFSTLCALTSLRSW